MSAPTKEQLKARSKHLAKLLQEKYNIKVSHGHCLDVISQLFGSKDWNTMSASAPSEPAKEVQLDGRQALIRALNDGFNFYVEQPYKIDKYHVGGSNASHHVEQGTAVATQFDIRVDHYQRSIALTLPLTKGEVASDSVVLKAKTEYNNFFEQKLYMRDRNSEDINPLHRDLQDQAEKDMHNEMKKYYPNDDRS